MPVSFAIRVLKLAALKAMFDNQDGEIHPGVAGVMYLENAGVAVAD